MIPVRGNWELRHAIPIPFLVAGFILASLCLSAGNKAGFMEEYALVRIDMSGLGNNLFTSSNETSSDDEDKEDEDDEDDDDEDDSIIPDGVEDLISFRHRRQLGDAIDDAKEKVKEKVGELGNELVDGLTEDLGVKDWYSLHILTFCQGEFKNSTDNDTEVNKHAFEVDECSKPTSNGEFNLTEVLGTDSLSAGPIDIPIPSGIERQLQRLYKVVIALIVFYAATIGFTVLAFFTNIAAIFFTQTYPYRFMRAIAWMCILATSSALIGSVTATIVIITVSEALGDLGELIGVRVVRGWQFLAITWSMFGVVFIASTYWALVYLKEWKSKRGVNEEEHKALKRELERLVNQSKKSHRQFEHEKTSDYFMNKARAQDNV